MKPQLSFKTLNWNITLVAFRLGDCSWYPYYLAVSVRYNHTWWFSLMSFSSVLSCYSVTLKKAYFRNTFTTTKFESHKIQHKYSMRKLCGSKGTDVWNKGASFLLKYSISLVHVKMYRITCQQFPELFEYSQTHEFEKHQVKMIFNMHTLE
jgi:hypothetical protein